MASFAEAEFAITVPGEDGFSLKDHLLTAWEKSGVIPQELADQPECPEMLGYLWEYFQKLQNRRNHNGFAFQALLPSEVKAWAELYRIKLDRWEIDAIFTLDTLYLASRVKPKGK